MAITNAQQFKQLVNPPMKGKKRPGYRGDDAYGGGDSVAGGGDQGNVGGNRDAREIGARMSRTQAMARANQRALAALGDPDPEVDVATKDRRDTITSFGKNLKANLKSNPFSMITPLGTLLTTAYQTGKARDMLGLTTPTDDDDDDRGNGDGQSIILPPIMAQAPSIVEQKPIVEEEEPFQLSRRFRAEGGIMNTDVVGGEFDFESARQMYGLGKLVKKVTRSVKKIAKSPIGKAALLYAGTAGLGALGAGKLGTGFKFFGPQSFLAPSNVISNLGVFGTKLFANPTIAQMKTKGLEKGFFPSLLDKIPGGGITAGIVGTSLAAGLLTPEQEEEAQQISDETGIDIATIRANPNQYLARRFRAEGGSMDEPVAKKTMPLLDMGGKEMDLRAEGGFVQIGRMEKADDVPARLSKNEFVFTADAVRNAGDGDVDKGAEVMYNMMKNLESGGDVSEESQGLEGARKMFQTSQRLEEVL